jgi:hypothetical protein
MVTLDPFLCLFYVFPPSPPTPSCIPLPWSGLRSGDMGIDTGSSRRKSNSRQKEAESDGGVGVSAMEKRFAYSLLEKLLEYFDKAAVNMTQTRPSTRYSRRESYAQATEDVKFFGKVNSGYRFNIRASWENVHQKWQIM